MRAPARTRFSRWSPGRNRGLRHGQNKAGQPLLAYLGTPAKMSAAIAFGRSLGLMLPDGSRPTESPCHSPMMAAMARSRIRCSPSVHA